jgi:hypothetical protein
MVILAPVLFLTPVVSLHRLMKKARNHLLEPLTSRLTAILNDLEKGSVEASVISKEIEALVKVEEQVKRFPVWPLPMRQLIESASYLVPVQK